MRLSKPHCQGSLNKQLLTKESCRKEKKINNSKQTERPQGILDIVVLAKAWDHMKNYIHKHCYRQFHLVPSLVVNKIE
jgi:hypothetical protein